jgi:hypothetical protein
LSATSGSGGVVYAGCPVSNSFIIQTATTSIRNIGAGTYGGVAYMTGGIVIIKVLNIATFFTISSGTSGGAFYTDNTGATTL